MLKKMGFSEKIFYIVIFIFLTLLMFLTLYPILLVFSMSISDPINVINGEVLLFPKGLSLESYLYVMNDQEMWLSYGNTIYYYCCWDVNKFDFNNTGGLYAFQENLWAEKYNNDRNNTDNVFFRRADSFVYHSKQIRAV